MNDKEREALRQFVGNVIYDKHRPNEKKVDLIVAYTGSVMKKYEIIAKFDEIDVERDRNLRNCWSRVTSYFSVCGCFVTVFKWTFIFLLLVSLALFLIFIYLLRFSSTTSAP